MSGTELGDAARSITISSPLKSESKSQQHCPELRQILREKWAEFSTIEADWRSQDAAYNSECEQLVAELRDLELQFEADQQASRERHLADIAELKRGHQAAVLDLQLKLKKYGFPTIPKPWKTWIMPSRPHDRNWRISMIPSPIPMMLVLLTLIKKPV
jgi:hypothetical protein